MQVRRVPILLAFVFALSGVLPAQPPPPAPPSLAFEEQAVVVSGVTPKGKVVWFSVAREIEDYAGTVVRREDLLEDEDGDGQVRFELDRPVPKHSVWIAVDLASGALALAVPEGSSARPMPEAGRSPGRGGAGRPEWAEIGRPYLELAVIRPGQGAWGLTLGDGGGHDEDGETDGRSVAALARMRALGDSPGAPELFLPKDLIAVVDPNRMEYTVETLVPTRP